MKPSYSHWLNIILVFSDLTKTQNTQNTEDTSIQQRLNEAEFFGDYIKFEVENVLLQTNTQSEITTIILNCLLRNNANDEKENVIELFKKINNGPLSKVDEFLNENITSFKDLDEVFKKINNWFTSKRKIVTTYGHGCAFGIFAQRASPALTDAIKKHYSLQTNINHNFKWFKDGSKFLTNAVENFMSESDNRGYAEDLIPLEKIMDDKNNFLSNEELATAIEGAFGKIDIVLMNNCLMQNMYTQYAFKDACEFLIAPQTGITYPGVDLNTVYQNLLPEKTNKQITQQIINSFKNSNAENKVFEKYCIVGFDLTKYSDLVSTIRKIQEYLMKAMEDNEEYYHNVVNAFVEGGCLPFDQPISPGRAVFDLYQLTEALTKIDKSDTLKIHFEELSKFFTDNEICFIHVGKSVHQIEGYQGIINYSNKNLWGLSIYFPLNKKAVNSILDTIFIKNVTRTPLGNKVPWQNILQVYKPLNGYYKDKFLDNTNGKIETLIWLNPPGNE